MKTVALTEFVDFLDRQTEASFRDDAIDRYLEANQLESDDFAPYIFFREDKFARNLVYRNELCELLVLTWLPNQFTPIHDHDGQRCWMMMHSGALTFHHFKAISSSTKKPIAMGEPTVFRTGEHTFIEDSMGIHSISNPGNRPAVSIHLYAGPVEKCRIYDEKSARFTETPLNYFTEYAQESDALNLDSTLS